MGIRVSAVVTLLWAAALAVPHAQQAPAPSPVLTPVPRVMWLSGVFLPVTVQPIASVESVTVAIYREREGGEALWQETQSVAMEPGGRYSLLMGSTLADGLPPDLFTSGEARWMGITFNRPGEVEQPRVPMASVPYALKAADADTLGGLPASAYLRAGAPASRSSASHSSASMQAAGPAGAEVITPLSSGTPGYLGLFTDSTNLGNSVLYQSGNAIALGTTVPRDTFHVSFHNGNGGQTGYSVQNLSGAANAYSGMLFYDQDGTLGLFQGYNNATHEYRINNVGSGGSISFRIGSTPRFTVANNGNIGIGISNPTFKLEVVNASNTGLRVQTNVPGGTVASFGGFGDFSIDAAGIPAGRFNVRENGSVGIGPGVPLARLQVVTAHDTNPGLISAWDSRHFVVGGPVSNGGIGMSYDQVNHVGYIEALSPNVAFRNLVLQFGGGNVGIGTGTTSPTEKLSVAGTVHSTTGGFKFPDDSVQTTAIGPTYTALRVNQLYLLFSHTPPVLSLSSLPPGTYLLTATVAFGNNADYDWPADNNRDVYCQFSEGIPYRISIPHFDLASLTIHAVMTITTGSVDLICSRLYENHDQVYARERRITAVKIGGNVVVQ